MTFLLFFYLFSSTIVYKNRHIYIACKVIVLTCWRYFPLEFNEVKKTQANAERLLNHNARLQMKKPALSAGKRLRTRQS